MSEDTSQQDGALAECSRVHFPGISPTAWEHPLDRAALETLRKVPALDQVLKKVFGALSERGLRLMYLANAVRVGPDQFPSVYQVHLECCSILDMDEVPELFITQTPLVNAGAVGMDQPFIVLNSGTLNLFDEDELRLVLGHELAHIASGHVLYKTLLKMMLSFTLPMVGRMAIPMAGIAMQGVTMALLEWNRKSEFTSDRAGLLCVQKPESAYRTMMKTAGGGSVSEMSVDAFVRQAEEYTASGNMADKALKFMNLAGQTHPFPVLRLAELKRWVEEGEYTQIMGGQYPLKADDGPEENPQWTEDPDGNEDSEPMADLFQNLGQTVSDATTNLSSQLKGVMDAIRTRNDDDSNS